MKKNLRSTNGQVLIFVSLAIVVLGLFVGLAADAGSAYLMRARLSKMVDAAAIAGARVMDQGEEVAHAAACDSAHVNSSLSGVPSGTCPPGVVVDTVPIPDSNPAQTGVKVSARLPMSTSFIRLGTLIGCGAPCETFNVAATATAAPGVSFADVVEVLDTTSSMQGLKITNAKLGAQAVVDMLLGSTGSSGSKVAVVPFRGCYTPANPSNQIGGCVDVNDIVDLTDNKLTLTTGIAKLQAAVSGLGSGTNVCLGLHEGSVRLTGQGSRPEAKKYIIILTDAQNHLKDQVSEQPPCNVGNSGSDLELDRKTMKELTDIHSAVDVEIFVIDYGTAPNSSAPCNLSDVGRVDDDHNLAKCIASPDTSYPHYFAAPTPEEIKKSFQIIANLLLQLRLTN